MPLYYNKERCQASQKMFCQRQDLKSTSIILFVVFVCCLFFSKEMIGTTLKRLGVCMEHAKATGER